MRTSFPLTQIPTVLKGICTASHSSTFNGKKYSDTWTASSKRAEVNSPKFKRISRTCFGQDWTYLHVDIADKLVLKLLQYAGNYAGELLQQAKISHRFGSDDVSVGRYQRSGNSAALFASFLKTGSLFLHVFVSFPPIFPQKTQIRYTGMCYSWGLLATAGCFPASIGIIK